LKQQRAQQQLEYGRDENHHLLHVDHHMDNACCGKVHGVVSSLRQVVTLYLFHDVFSSRRLAILTGIVCALGNVLQFMGGELVGYATADLVQAFPIISTIWDVYLFGEFPNVQVHSWFGFLLVTIYVTYIAGILLLFSSSLM
jgi:glucose uptake protein GlcU